MNDQDSLMMRSHERLRKWVTSNVGDGDGASRRPGMEEYDIRRGIRTGTRQFERDGIVQGGSTCREGSLRD